MKKVLGKEELEAYPAGATVPVPPDTIVTPLGRDYAKEQGLTLLEGAQAPTPVELDLDALDEEAAVVAAVADEVVRTMMAGGGERPRKTPAEETPAELAGHRGVVTATGRNSPGILADLSAEIARHEVDIVDLSQTIVAGFFTMILVIDTRPLGARGVTFADFRDRIVTVAQERGFEAMVVHERVLQAMQRV